MFSLRKVREIHADPLREPGTESCLRARERRMRHHFAAELVAVVVVRGSMFSIEIR